MSGPAPSRKAASWSRMASTHVAVGVELGEAGAAGEAGHVAARGLSSPSSRTLVLSAV